MDLQGIVNAHQHKFSETEREILAFMLENEEFVAESTISSLAHKTYTSTSSIIRLTKKLDFSGFAELKYFIKSSLAQAEPINPDFIASGTKDIARTLEALQRADLDPILKLLDQARTVYCYGTGYAQRNALQEFAKSMLACGKFMHVIPARNEFKGAVSAMTQQDAVVLVSLSGNTESIKDTIQLLSVRKIPTLAITVQSVNLMSTTANYSLHYEATPTTLPRKKEPYHSFVALNVLLDYLVRRYIDVKDRDRP